MTEPKASVQPAALGLSQQNSGSSQSSLKLGVGGGAGGGTGLALWGEALGPHSNLGKFLILAAPLTSVLLASALLYTRAQLRIKTMRRAIERALETLNRKIEDPNTPEAAKDEYKTKVAEAHAMQAEAEMTHLQFIERFWR